MTIEQIDSNRILIALCDDDMKSFSLEFESMTLSDPHVKEMIQRLLKFASNETGISVKTKNAYRSHSIYKRLSFSYHSFTENSQKKDI